MLAFKKSAIVVLSLTLIPMKASALPVLTSGAVLSSGTPSLILVAESRKATETKIMAQRKAIREHIEKYNTYPLQQDKDFALKTIRNVQNNIAKLRAKQPSIAASYEDTWKP